MELQDITDECLASAHDSHHVAGLLLADKIDVEAIKETAKTLQRTAVKLRKLAESVELSKTLKGKKTK